MGEVLAFRPHRSDEGGSPRTGQLFAPSERPEVTEQRQDSGGPEPDSSRAAAGHPHDRLPRKRHRAPLWREVTGAVLRDERHRQRRTLAQVAGRAGMSAQYLSQLERGQKEASSEMLAAACGSLGLGMAEFAVRCARFFAGVSSQPSGPVLLAA